MSLAIQRWRSYSTRHLEHARDMAVAAQDIESRELAAENKRHDAQQAHVIAAVIFSAMTLEASINELFTECALFPFGEQARDLPTTVQKRMKEIGERSIGRQARLRVLDKFDLALMLADKETFDSSRPPYQDAAALIDMRNELIHHVPEWKVVGTTEIDEASRVGKKLNGKFPLNPLAVEGDALFPEKCLGAGCARWAVITAADFLCEFYTRMGIALARISELGGIKQSLAASKP